MTSDRGPAEIVFPLLKFTGHLVRLAPFAVSIRPFIYRLEFKFTVNVCIYRFVARITT